MPVQGAEKKFNEVKACRWGQKVLITVLLMNFKITD
jgi:hypothetical protein